MGKKNWLIMFFVAQAVIIAGFAIYRMQSVKEAEGPNRFEKPPEYVHQSGQFARGILTLEKDADPMTFKLVVDPPTTMNNRLVGTFETAGKKPVQVLLMNNENYAKWRKEEAYTAVYESGKVSSGMIDITVPEIGLYHLVLSNKNPASVEITVDILREYDVRKP